MVDILIKRERCEFGWGIKGTIHWYVVKDYSIITDGHRELIKKLPDILEWYYFI
jgi:hypothetical protein